MGVVVYGCDLFRSINFEIYVGLVGMAGTYILRVFCDPYVHRATGGSKWHKLAKNMKF